MVLARRGADAAESEARARAPLGGLMGMHTRPVIDLSTLPTTELDHRSAIWWGNVILLMIETTMFALLVGGYFYLRTNFHEWPPPFINGPYVLLNSAPALAVPSLNLALLLVSCGPMIWADRAALHM